MSLIVRGCAVKASDAAFIPIMPGILTVRTRADDARVGMLITIATSPGATFIDCPEAAIVPDAIDIKIAPGVSVNVSADEARTAEFIEMLCGADPRMTVNV